MNDSENTIRDIFKEEIEKYASGNRFNISKIPVHAHTGKDTTRINPQDLIGFKCVDVADSTVAPTDTPENGTIRFQYDTDSWNLWVRINNLWKTASLS